MPSFVDYQDKSVYKPKPFLTQHINAPVSFVWSIVRRFDNELCNPWAESCSLISGDGDAGSIRVRNFISALPTKSSIERLDTLDDSLHIMSFTIIGGDTRLLNFRCTALLQEKIGEPHKTVALFSYRFERLIGNTEAETYYIYDKIVEFYLQNLAFLAEKMNPNVLRGKSLKETGAKLARM